MRMLCVPLEQVQNVLHAQVRGRFTLYSSLGKRAFLFLQVENALLDRICDGDLVNNHINSLVEAVDTVNSLFFDKLRTLSVTSKKRMYVGRERRTHGIPERFKDDNPTSGCQIQAQRSALETAQ